jgi:UDP-N-acetylmuramoyl-tripeptide--D-alanyl-D-alanine ligase
VDTLKCAFGALAEASAARRILVISDVTDTSQSPRDRLRRIGRDAAGIFDAAVFIGEAARHGVRGAVEGGMKPEDAHQFLSAETAEDFLRKDLRAGDLVLLRGRTSDRLSRLPHALRGTVECRKTHCDKTVLCDLCPELGASVRPGDL